MKPNIQSILEDCIERGIRSALIDRDADCSDNNLADDIQRHIWFEIDIYFNFEE